MADRPAVPTSKFLHLKGRTGGNHIEEIEYHVAGGHPPLNGTAPLGNLPPLQPPLPPPDPPPPNPNDPVTWTWDEKTRVYLGDFRKVEVVSNEQQGFLALLLERDDFAVVLEDGLPEKFECDFQVALEKGFRADPSYGKFQRFSREEDANEYEKKGGAWRMKVPDFLMYLAVMNGDAGADPRPFVVMDDDENEETIEPCDFKKNVFYMTDIDKKHFHEINKAFMRTFKFKQILPSGTWCMTHDVNIKEETTIPNLGPNCFITPGGGYTQMHQDGHGMVDSVHVCLQGYNEVVMLRRLPEEHKQEACRLVPDGTNGAISDATRAYNIMYRTPNDLDREDEPLWASNDVIQIWEAMGYCPAVFILKPGQCLVINAGRMHAFRKATPDELPEQDCHHDLRKALKREIEAAPLCVLLAWDWHFLGVTAEGINRHCAAAVESAWLCRANNARPLGIAQVAIIETAVSLALDQVSTDPHRPPKINMAAGILATLTHIVEEERSAPDLSQCTDLQDLSDDSTDKKNSYVCTLCDHDITNTYYQCLGCSNLDQDYIVCLPCFKEKRHLKDQAKICKHLVGSSRHVFKKHFRLYTPDFLKDVLACVAELADGNAVGFGHETYCRLQRRVLVQGPEEAEHPGYGNYGSYGELLFPTALTTTTVNDTGAAEAGAESSQTSSRRRTNGDGHLVSVQQLADPAAARPVPILAAPAAVSRGQGGEVEEEEDDNIGQRKYIKEFPFPISKGECVLWNLTVPAKKKGIRSNQYYYTPPNSEGKGKKIRSLNALQLFVCKETPNTFELLGHTFRFEEARQGTGAVLIPPFVYQGDAVDCPEKFVEFIDPLWQWALDNGWNPKENQTA